MENIVTVGLLLLMFQGWTLAKVNDGVEYSNVWVANIEGGEEVAKRVARILDFTYKGKFTPFEDHYEFVKEDFPKISLQNSEHLTRSLLDLNEVKWAQQQEVMEIVHKDLIADEEKNIADVERDTERDCTGSSCSLSFGFSNLVGNLFQGSPSYSKFSTRPAPHLQLSTYEGTTKHIGLFSNEVSVYSKRFNDPLWNNQWYLQDYRTEDGPVMDHNVVKVYDMGYTGKGVTVGVIDTPIQIDHPDLQKNIDLENSFDMCSDLPLAQVQNTLEPDEHGTSSAGVIAMVAGNNLCGVGIAYKAKIAAINHECKGKLPNSVRAKGLVQNLGNIDIYSNSWGPRDKFNAVFVMDHLIKKAYMKGVTEGRNGKGVIYVHSSGNGGTLGDHCATDYTINQPYVLGITSADHNGEKNIRSERCTAIFATTYSGSEPHIRDRGTKVEGVVTLTIKGWCREGLTDTSAPAPLAAGMIALVLEANPDLTYRDVMHIVARSSEVAPLADNRNTWYRNGQGFWVSNDFGFGLMNAENMVLLAKEWENVPRKTTCIKTFKLDTPEVLSEKRIVSISFTTEGCQKTSESAVLYLEHIEVAPIVEYPGNRGDILLSITSPAKTKSVLLERKVLDTGKGGIEGWSVMSTHNWGENPKGKWTLDVEVEDINRSRGITGLVKEFTITFHGIPERPAHLEKLREYSAFRLPDGRNELGTVS